MDRPCTVLQYADDTLIVARADEPAVSHLKHQLQRFSKATGMCINYSKSTLVPMHVVEDDVPVYVNILGCTPGTFPQTYLGLPLSNEKLKLSAFVPIISNVDRYLSGWWASLLNYQGRLILVNVVLDNLPIYVMGALLLPQGIMDALDARCCAFLWAGKESVSGAQCLSVAHLIARCVFAAGFWCRLDITLTEGDVSQLWNVQPPATLPWAYFNAFLLLCCWRL
ncbi:hypothetical protein PR202_gb16799 [Eleusine coracana subsp. coracana]|uniref:Reverse transcriptase domain-containing protein n=1 Tax=Eleusine coracana subsp. coracana TaxID=191504 RepID=A0AAV5F2T4_ELECO|nr:hypothetical protein PR202_gb16799 [Eleusine coracana subsp. coracana]